MNNRKKIVYSVLGAIILVLIVVFITSLLRRFNTAAKLAAENQKIAAIAKAEDQTLKNTFDTIAKTDSDFDGLSNTEEIKLGTDPNKSDTDVDGLNDYVEVKIYQTNPLKTDTYGLGHSDSWGVRRALILPGGKIDKQMLTKLNITLK